LEAKLNDAEKRYIEEKDAHQCSNDKIILYKQKLKEMMEKESRLNASNSDNHHGHANDNIRAAEGEKDVQRKDD